MNDGTIWSERRTRGGRSVTAYERSDRNGQIWLRWSEPGARSPKREATSIKTIRDRRGRELQGAIKEARAAADAKLAEILEGITRRKAGPLTLTEGIALAFSERGLWPNKEGRYERETARRLADAVRILGGGSILWEDITPGMLRSIWRRMFAEFRDKGKPGEGHNHAQKTVTNLLSVANWLAGEFPRQKFPRGPRHWQKELREYWSKQGHPIDRKAYRQEKRHTVDEIIRLFAARHDPRVHPRARLYLVLASRLRGGQFDRAMRSHYNPNAGIKMRRGYLGLIKVPYPAERKRVPPLTLNWKERLELERVLRRGYLSDLERAYKAGEISDYSLFPSGRFRQGKAVVNERSKKPIETSRMIEHFHDIERIAGVEVIRFRGRHGLRRTFSDIDQAQEDVGDEVKDVLGGWVQGSTMRRGIYNDGERPELLEQAAKVRARPLRRRDNA